MLQGHIWKGLETFLMVRLMGGGALLLVFSGLWPGVLLKSYKAQESPHKKNDLDADVNSGSDEKS